MTRRPPRPGAPTPPCRTARAARPRAPPTHSTGPQSPSARSSASPSVALPGSVAGSSGIGPTPKACTNHAVSPDAGVEVEAVADALLGEQQRDVVGARDQPRAGQPARGEHRDQLEPAQQQVGREHARPGRWRSGRAASAGRRCARRRRSRRRSRSSARRSPSRRSARRPAASRQRRLVASRQGAAPSAGGVAAMGTGSSLRRRRSRPMGPMSARGAPLPERGVRRRSRPGSACAGSRGGRRPSGPAGHSRPPRPSCRRRR